MHRAKTAGLWRVVQADPGEYRWTSPHGFAYLVTPDELPGGVRPTLAVRCEVDGEVMQSDNTGDLLFDPVALVEYISTMVRLNPGDIIATGTPAGVGPIRDGQTVRITIDGLGEISVRVA